MPINPGEKTEKQLREAIDFCHLNIKPEQAFAFSILFILLTLLPVTILTFANIFGFHLLPFGYGVIFIFLLLLLTYYVYTYPMHLKLKYEMEVGSDIVSLIIYISIYMRNVPNIENAVKFDLENGSVDVRVENNSELKISVSDTGVGIESAKLDSIVGFFHRGSDILSYNFEGGGMGLYLTNLIVKHYNGQMHVTSEKDKGSTFEVILKKESK